MTTSAKGQPKGALELLEEAFHLLRAGGVAAIALHCVGSLPFVLGLIYFWMEMSYSAFGARQCATLSMGLAGLYVWMKCWQSAFAGRLLSLVGGQAPPRWTWRSAAALTITQATIQPIGLLARPLALACVLPFAQVSAYFQNVTVLGQLGSIRGLLQRSSKAGAAATPMAQALTLAMLWPGQVFRMMLILCLLFGVAFANVAMTIVFVPQLLRMLLGVETAWSLLQSGGQEGGLAFVAAVIAIVCIDPLVKAAYVLRCFYGFSVRTGEDLKAELAELNRNAAGRQKLSPMAVAVIAAVVLGSLAAWGGPETANAQRPTLNAVLEKRSTRLAQVGAESNSLATAKQSDSGQFATRNSQLAASESQSLDRAIDQTIHKSKYAWRLPRDPAEIDNSKNTWLSRMIDDVYNAWIKPIGDWFDKLFRKKSSQNNEPQEHEGTGWNISPTALMWTFLGIVVAGAAVLGVRAWMRRKAKAATSAGGAVEPFVLPDLSDANVTADQLPEDEWMALAAQMIQKGELRLALRAMYLSVLSYLGQQQLVLLRRHKSNRDYRIELARRAHERASLIDSFGRSVSMFDRAWYGRDPVSSRDIEQFGLYRQAIVRQKEPGQLA